MIELQKKHDIPDSFFQRYFIRNAENTFVNKLKKFMLWREGSFPNPKDKMKHVRAFLANEIENFYDKGQFHLPQIGFALTTRCTLLCRDCIALTPLFNDRSQKEPYPHIDLSAEDFRREMAAIANSVNGIKRLFLHGGEPLMNGDLPEIVEFSASCDKIELVEIITNGTIAPSSDLLDAIAAHKHKIYLAINNYSRNQELEGRLKNDKIIPMLDARGIKHPLYSELKWYREAPLANMGYTPEEVKRMFNDCWCKHSLQIMDGKLAVCPRASVGLQLGFVETPADDFIDLRKSDSSGLRRELIDFYKKDSYAACGFCIPQTELVEPAVQIGG